MTISDTIREEYLAANEQAEAACRGRYQEALIAGSERWSGASLRGKARHWGSSYARSRAALLDRIEDGWLHAGRDGRVLLILGHAAHCLIETAPEFESSSALPMWVRCAIARASQPVRGAVRRLVSTLSGSPQVAKFPSRLAKRLADIDAAAVAFRAWAAGRGLEVTDGGLVSARRGYVLLETGRTWRYVHSSELTAADAVRLAESGRVADAVVVATVVQP